MRVTSLSCRTAAQLRLPDRTLRFADDLQQAIPNIASLTGPGSFAFLDNLVIGLPPNVPHEGDPGLTLVEARSHFSLWVMMASPLLLNHDIFHLDPEITAIISNREVCHTHSLAVNFPLNFYQSSSAPSFSYCSGSSDRQGSAWCDGHADRWVDGARDITSDTDTSASIRRWHVRIR